ncbi:Methionine aminopeptidase (EC 3.4.11.18) [uncultured Gammaproteobacteria bacterium]|jgi:methionyl aminopeptidase|uniref:type I methionyl aminopeptidase n=1 Tax=thiotrophic endosymbiont of Bathymodiolus puteoserpentis (Logatchev) TaxID=343240 RepID=UPI0010BABFA8|nr:type I methionyl aminopeptidase [thiotrophic endosymbiont of Bathymodiolus puteoserpentis (Logatchev)]CAC9579732.1 Methionine aminopeptidase (EC 3.4.11.18) [uncultured Gammaproteobacteria bacterium]CAC9582495.1 Methionine aminopeptidase (EC 3.4.11.18) [uncultured Gammaproteobacteria bacterium]CAC9643827.1 Methionine aminopeptidase (EC 3.4.11.18) [uncultured Gammaproteobacteria bacterium]CAC9958137.1 Methionine aminopeptidase (EC 3.4.11.18) [uncultured Gammaproteobacteria bacterium]SSC10329.
MAIDIKSADEIEKMRIAGRLAAQVLDMITPHVKSGVSTDELDTICHDYIVNVQDAIPAPLNYHGFPKSICTSINNVVCHGIPGEKKLKKGDIVNIDITVIKDAYHGDTSKMFIIGKSSVKAQRICRIAQECLYIGIEKVKPGIHLGEIGKAIGAHVIKNNCSIVRDYCGHGIGSTFHAEPQVVHYDDDNIANSPILEEGMTFTIEPMVNLGGFEVATSTIDGWTVTTKDRSLSAQWEHTILVTKSGYEILTLRDEEVDAPVLK